ncbi:MAG: 5'-3' exonuclease H3TH domain-containing protein [Dehalococcoidia bacterium]
MRVHLIDGTYELFRHYFALPSRTAGDGVEVAAVRGVLGSVLSLLREGATHVGVATDHVIESFRNELWPSYKTGEGIAPGLYGQFPILERGLAAMGVAVWAMVEYEADDALAAGAVQAEAYAGQVVICTPDKDLAQCVIGTRVVQLDRRKGIVMDENGVVAKFGVLPCSIPDLLALAGDSADGFPGLPGWGAKSAAAVLSKFGHIEDIPADPAAWGVPVRGAPVLSATLEGQRELAMLFKDLATLRTNVPIDASEEALRWRGPREDFGAFAEYLDAPELMRMAEQAAQSKTA